MSNPDPKFTFQGRQLATYRIHWDRNAAGTFVDDVEDVIAEDVHGEFCVDGDADNLVVAANAAAKAKEVVTTREKSDGATEDIFNILKPYDGADPNTKSEPCCTTCYTDWKGKDGSYQPRKCARCKLVRYCSRSCQREHFFMHKKECKNIKKLSDALQAEATRMESLTWGLGGPPENVLRTQVGSFWEILETRPYCRARYTLYDAIYRIAYKGEQSEQWEQALDHLLEIMRLCRSDNMGLRFKASQHESGDKDVV